MEKGQKKKKKSNLKDLNENILTPAVLVCE